MRSELREAADDLAAAAETLAAWTRWRLCYRDMNEGEWAEEVGKVVESDKKGFAFATHALSVINEMDDMLIEDLRVAAKAYRAACEEVDGGA